MTTRHLYGPWEALLVHTLPAPATTRPAPGATVRFERHPDHADSLRGTLHTQQPATAWPTEAQLSGDVDGGELVLDESDDGQRITAVWVGTAVPGTCGQEIQGTRRLADESTGTHFVLKRTAGW